ncbi:hypothetical protein PR048_024318 [Dryococelus australis]|uniref:Uncharacterized protein n=1 Tax=Dryococelus australis TaxID=614101 RepID=A0ABQ9GNA6_9NEOP|nr:hypothetical protein PR048_024318 [Dryococelus australis]
MQGRGVREYSEVTHRPTATSATFPTCETPEAPLQHHSAFEFPPSPVPPIKINLLLHHSTTVIRKQTHKTRSYENNRITKVNLKQYFGKQLFVGTSCEKTVTPTYYVARSARQLFTEPIRLHPRLQVSQLPDLREQYGKMCRTARRGGGLGVVDILRDGLVLYWWKGGGTHVPADGSGGGTEEAATGAAARVRRPHTHPGAAAAPTVRASEAERGIHRPATRKPPLYLKVTLLHLPLVIGVDMIISDVTQAVQCKRAPAPVRSNAATILREGAKYMKEQEEEIKRLVHSKGMPEKTRLPAASFYNNLKCENPRATPQDIEPVQPRWEAGGLTTTPPWHLLVIRILASQLGEPGSITGGGGGELTDFRKWESCRTMPLVCGFSRDLFFTPPFIPALLHSHLISLSSTLKISLREVHSCASKVERAIRATLTRTPSASSLLRARQPSRSLNSIQLNHTETRRIAVVRRCTKRCYTIPDSGKACARSAIAAVENCGRLEEMVAGGSNYLELEEMEAAQRRRREAEELEAVERRRLQGLLTKEEARLARLRLQQAIRARAQVFLAEVRTLHSQLHFIRFLFTIFEPNL